MKIYCILFLSIELVFCTGCFSTFRDRQEITENIFEASFFDKLYTQKSYLALLPPEDRQKYLTLHKEAVIEFYAQNLTIRELQSLAQFQDETAIQHIRKLFWSGADISMKNIDDALATADLYPVIKKISSEQFKNALSQYVSEKVLNERK